MVSSLGTDRLPGESLKTMRVCGVVFFVRIFCVLHGPSLAKFLDSEFYSAIGLRSYRNSILLPARMRISSGAGARCHCAVHLISSCRTSSLVS